MIGVQVIPIGIFGSRGRSVSKELERYSKMSLPDSWTSLQHRIGPVSQLSPVVARTALLVVARTPPRARALESLNCIAILGETCVCCERWTLNDQQGECKSVFGISPLFIHLKKCSGLLGFLAITPSTDVKLSGLWWSIWSSPDYRFFPLPP